MMIELAARCAKCNRPMKVASDDGFGPKCRRAMTGAKPRRMKRELRRSRDDRQLELLEAA